MPSKLVTNQIPSSHALTARYGQRIHASASIVNEGNADGYVRMILAVNSRNNSVQSVASETVKVGRDMGGAVVSVRTEPLTWRNIRVGEKNVFSASLWETDNAGNFIGVLQRHDSFTITVTPDYEEEGYQ